MIGLPDLEIEYFCESNFFYFFASKPTGILKFQGETLNLTFVLAKDAKPVLESSIPKQVDKIEESESKEVTICKEKIFIKLQSVSIDIALSELKN